MQVITRQTDILVLGGGLPGVCAAISAKRRGAQVILVEKAMTLGGNCGPEIGVHPSDGHRYHPYMAATGVVAEIIEEATRKSAKTNTKDYHYNICSAWDGIMSDALRREGVVLLKRHYAHTPAVENGKITEVICEDTATYTRVVIKVNGMVIDASGDGNISAEAGALFRTGREAKSEYGERLAPEKADDITLGSSVVALVQKQDHPVEFVPPENTPGFFPGYWGDIDFNPDPDETLRFFFPTESGGEKDTIKDEHEIYETLLGQLYSSWNRIKNVTCVEKAKNWELLWVSSRTGKRESRRFIGDYVLTQTDVENGKIFDDAVAVGGFYTDVHYPNPENRKYVQLFVGSVPPTYTIPYRCIYSKNIDNLIFASRLLSVSHLAHASVRVQRTLSSIGQAAGTAAGMCVEKGISPRELGEKHIKELQQTLIADDACIPLKEEKNSLSYTAKITASSEQLPKICGNEEYISIKKNTGLQLWSFGEKIDTVRLYVKAEKAEKLTLEVLRYSNPDKWQHKRLPFGKFERFKTANETEWGLDNRCEMYTRIATAFADVPENHEGYVTFDLKLVLPEKDMMNDEDKLMMVFDADYEAKLRVSKTPYDFARLVTGTADSSETKIVHDDIKILENVADVREKLPESKFSYVVTDGSPLFETTPEFPVGKAENIINGYTRRFSTNPMNMWRPAELPAGLCMKWEKKVFAHSAVIYFDTLMRAFREEPFECGKKASPQCAKDFEVVFKKDGEIVKTEKIYGNVSRKCKVPAEVEFDQCVICILSCHEEGFLPGVYKIDFE